MEEEIKALVKVVNDLVEQNKILIQILLSRPQSPQYFWDNQVDKLKESQSGLFGKKDKCRRCGWMMETPMTTWVGGPPPKRCERPGCEHGLYGSPYSG